MGASQHRGMGGHSLGENIDRVCGKECAEGSIKHMQVHLCCSICNNHSEDGESI